MTQAGIPASRAHRALSHASPRLIIAREAPLMPSPLTGKTLQLREVKLLAPAHTALHQQSRGWKTQTSACRAEWISSGSFVGTEGAENTIDFCRIDQFYTEALNWTLTGS